MHWIILQSKEQCYKWPRQSETSRQGRSCYLVHLLVLSCHSELVQLKVSGTQRGTSLRWEKPRWDGKNLVEVGKTSLRWGKPRWDGKNLFKVGKTSLRWEKPRWGGKNLVEVGKTSSRWEKFCRHCCVLSIEHFAITIIMLQTGTKAWKVVSIHQARFIWGLFLFLWSLFLWSSGSLLTWRVFWDNHHQYCMLVVPTWNTP